ncbi:MAG: prepilin-type N-terminal cleavage/methylation domain-containing protein [Planctomycetota bacterium]|nr:prepilin-type N-terminal cleavage/methylation domain-containing protein [Planctomycetota bacterium]
MRSRKGLTLLEVIFSMVVLLVGLVAIVFLIPLAGREAEDSQQITQGLAAGESALAMFTTTSVAQPTLESPWCLVDDIGSVEHSVATMRDAFNAAARTFPVPPNAVQAAIAQNEAIGIGFCIDPLFWGYQNRATNDVALPFFRTRFPFMFDNTDPILLVSNQNIPRAPRLLRGSLSDPQLTVRGSWLRQPAAVRLATMYGGDLVQPSGTKNKAIGPLRSVYVDANGSILSDRVKAIYQQNLLANQPLDVPRLYDVALVVFSKRDVRELAAMAVLSPGDFQNSRPSEVMNVPTGERVVKVTDMSSDALHSGTFNIEVSGYPTMDSKVKAGDWLMLSRFAFRDLIPRPSGTISRQVNRWYRIISVTGDGYPLSLRIAGKPWDWTEGEISDLLEKGQAIPTLPPAVGTYQTQAVIMKDVVQVYERQMELR